MNRLPMLRNIYLKNAQNTLFQLKNRGRLKTRPLNHVVPSSTSLSEHVEINKESLSGLWKKSDLQNH
jgi:hypothetical protein